MIKTLGYWLASRARKRPPSTIVLHATAGGSALSSIGWLKHIGLSYHYVIEDDGTVYKMVPSGRVALHAGVASGPEGSDVNGYSIGIAFAHSNLPSEGYTEAALTACTDLIAGLSQAYPSLRWLTTHYAITVQPDGSYRKSDPINFDKMQRVANGLTLWKPYWSKHYARIVYE